MSTSKDSNISNIPNIPNIPNISNIVNNNLVLDSEDYNDSFDSGDYDIQNIQNNALETYNTLETSENLSDSDSFEIIYSDSDSDSSDSESSMELGDIREYLSRVRRSTPMTSPYEMESPDAASAPSFISKYNNSFNNSPCSPSPLSGALTGPETSIVNAKLVRHKSIDMIKTMHNRKIDVPKPSDINDDFACNIPMCPKHGIISISNKHIDIIDDTGSESASSVNSNNSTNNSNDHSSNKSLSRSRSRSSITLNRSAKRDPNAVCIMQKYRKEKSISNIKAKLK